MDELTIEGLTPAEGHFPHHHKSRKTPSPTILTNGISSPSEQSDMSMDLTISSFETKSSLCPSPIISILRGSWHAHHYSKLPSAPTPFGIKDILDWGAKPNEDLVSTQEIEMNVKEEVEEDKVNPDQEMLSESSSPPLSPEPLSFESDEPLNLTVGKRETSGSPSVTPTLPDETNNNQLTNGSETHFTANRPFIRDKSPTAALLPNNVIIPKVKPPKTPVSSIKNGTAKNSSKGKDQSY